VYVPYFQNDPNSYIQSVDVISFLSFRVHNLFLQHWFQFSVKSLDHLKDTKIDKVFWSPTKLVKAATAIGITTKQSKQGAHPTKFLQAFAIRD
jgi:hypothetical protein